MLLLRLTKQILLHGSCWHDKQCMKQDAGAAVETARLAGAGVIPWLVVAGQERVLTAPSQASLLRHRGGLWRHSLNTQSRKGREVQTLGMFSTSSTKHAVLNMQFRFEASRH